MWLAVELVVVGVDVVAGESLSADAALEAGLVVKLLIVGDAFCGIHGLVADWALGSSSELHCFFCLFVLCDMKCVCLFVKKYIIY